MTNEIPSNITFCTLSDTSFELRAAPDVFTPNLTTRLLIDAVQQHIKTPAKLLDLGCGTGIVGLALHHAGLVAPPLHASDLSAPAVACSRENFEHYSCPAELREGSLFTPWADLTFEVIVNDISAIAREVATVSSWFQGVPCESGKDGTELVVDILNEAPRYLSEGGQIFFPVLSLSNAERILHTAHQQFASVEQVARKQWPLPDELKPHIPRLQQLAADGAISLEERFGRFLCSTAIYRGTSPV